MKYLYKYPQQAFPYQQLKQENQQRGLKDREFELIETGIFDNDRYFDVTVEYAKASDENILIFIQATNRSREKATIHLLPTLWFRNIWSWGYEVEKPWLKIYDRSQDYSVIEAQHPDLGKRWLYCANYYRTSDRQTPLLFTENDTNNQRLSCKENNSPYVKDAFHKYVVEGKQDAVNPDRVGTKFAAHYTLEIGAGETTGIQLRLCDQPDLETPFGQPFNDTFQIRQQEADEFYQRVSPYKKSLQLQNVERQAFAGMLWNKQFYYLDIEQWLAGDPVHDGAGQREHFSERRRDGCRREAR